MDWLYSSGNKIIRQDTEDNNKGKDVGEYPAAHEGAVKRVSVVCR